MYNKSKLLYVYGLGIFLFFFFQSTYQYYFQTDKIDPSRLIQIKELILAENLNYESVNGSKYIPFYFVNHKDTFYLEENNFYCSKSDYLVKNIWKGDTISILADPLFNSNEIKINPRKVYSIEYKNSSYGSANCLNTKFSQENQTNMVISLILISILVILLMLSK